MWGLPALLFASCEVAARATLDVSGRVVSSHTACQQPYNDRCVTTYTIQSPAGATHTFVYHAGPNDHSLQRELPPGTDISKEKWALVYRINGRLVDDFPINFYGIVAGVGLTLFLAGVVRVVFQLVHSNFGMQPDGVSRRS